MELEIGKLCQLTSFDEDFMLTYTYLYNEPRNINYSGVYKFTTGPFLIVDIFTDGVGRIKSPMYKIITPDGLLGWVSLNNWCQYPFCFIECCADKEQLCAQA